MSEKESAVPPEVQEALLNQLARKDERICMLEALLEEARKQGIEQELPVQKPPTHMSATPLRADRPPIKFPLVPGPSVDAIADVVLTKASPNARAFVGQQVSETAHDDYEPTARLDCNNLRQEHRALSIGRRAGFRQGGTVLVLLGLVALAVGTWRAVGKEPRFQPTAGDKQVLTAQSSQAQMPASRMLVPSPPVVDPAAMRANASITPASGVLVPSPPVVPPRPDTGNRVTRQDSARLQVPAVPVPSLQPAQPAFASSQPRHAFQPTPSRMSAATHTSTTTQAPVLRRQTAAVVRTTLFAQSKAPVLPVRERKHPTFRLVALQSHASHRVNAPAAPVSATGRQEAEQRDSVASVPQESTLAEKDLADNPPPAEPAHSAMQAHDDAVTHVDRAIKTLDKMRQLFDSMEQRKKSHAPSTPK